MNLRAGPAVDVSQLVIHRTFRQRARLNFRLVLKQEHKRMHVPLTVKSKAVRLKHLLVISVAMLFANPVAFAGELKVIELFTSQGCYSCPAADKLLAEMAAKDSDILNLEFHVDYWNQLQYRSAGNWEDPFSAAEFTQRQRQYSALNLRGENGVYTPQAVINGIYGHVGSNRRALKKGLEIANPRPVSVKIDRSGATGLAISVAGDAVPDAHIFLVNFLKKTSTNITSGENHDKIMENHNVVVDIQSVGTLAQAGNAPLQVPYAGGDNRGCAVLIQRERQGEILGAARCP